MPKKKPNQSSRFFYAYLIPVDETMNGQMDSKSCPRRRNGPTRMRLLMLQRLQRHKIISERPNQNASYVSMASEAQNYDRRAS